MEPAFAHMVCAWGICEFREPWSWILGQRMPSQPIDPDQRNLCAALSLILARFKDGAAYSKGDDNESKQNPVPERISPGRIPNHLR